MHEIEQFYSEVIDLLNIGVGGADENERDLLILTF